MRTLRSKNGMTMVEMAVGMFVASIVITGAYKLQADVSRSLEREREKSFLTNEILNVSRLVERDIRSVGYGLPGNGLAIFADEQDEFVLRMFSNTENMSTRLTSQVNSGSSTIMVENAEEFSEGEWICIDLGGLVEYHQISTVTLPSTINLETGLNVAAVSGSTVFPAQSRRYYIKQNRGLYREARGVSIRISDRIDIFDLVALEFSGQDVIDNVDQARLINLTLGGTVVRGGRESVFAETTEVNIRNAGF
ncbi:hypothetical protein CHISP_2967 [Chitinispirillum alkaliphilum]|nr:hypothetical protein CHISP_2967 [Chitinispirillum alkaliphilum]